MDGTTSAQLRLFEAGDYVYPTDLPRRFLCRVAAVDEFDAGGVASQILRLDPIRGPWPGGTRLVRLNSMVVGATRPAWRRTSRREWRTFRQRHTPARRTG